MRVGARPGMQNYGPDVEVHRVHGIMFPHDHRFAGSFQRFEELRSPITRSKPHRLASGYGRNFGLFVIKDVSDRQEFFNPDGSPRKLEFDLELCHFGWGSQFGGGVSLI